jgi:hypothetical protein
VQVRFFDIDWETDGGTPADCGLPIECMLDVDDESAADYDTIDGYLEEEGANLLSDRYGFLVNSCKFEIINQAE